MTFPKSLLIPRRGKGGRVRGWSMVLKSAPFAVVKTYLFCKWPELNSLLTEIMFTDVCQKIWFLS